jgi:DNA-binding MarR family transcriptional regulator
MVSEFPFGHYIIVIEKCTKKYLKEAFKEFDLNIAEGMVLLFLKRHDEKFDEAFLRELHHIPDGRTQEELVKELHYDKGVMTRTMQSLETKELVIREKNVTDSRSFIFRLTQKGQEFLPHLETTIKDWSMHLVDGFEAQELEVFERNLERLTHNALNVLKG